MRTTEREYWNAAAAEERAGRMAAEAVNECMTPAEAMALQVAAETFPEQFGAMLEQIFDDRSCWPSDDVSELWLSETGQTVWNVYRAYRALGTKARAA